MPDVEITVRLRRETGMHLSSVLAIGNVLFYNLLDEV